MRIRPQASTVNINKGAFQVSAMEERCANCPLLCKLLEPGDTPVTYHFSSLTPEQVMALVESSIHRFADWHHLRIDRSQRSCGMQLAMVLTVRYMPETIDNQLLLIAQAKAASNGQTELWFLYGVPKNCCEQAATRGFSTVILEVLEQIRQSEWLLQDHKKRQPELPAPQPPAPLL